MSERQTAKEAVQILCDAKVGFRRLNSRERQILATVLARKGRVVYGKAFDVVKCPAEVDFTDEINLTRTIE